MNGTVRFVLGAVAGAMLAFFGGQFVLNWIEPADDARMLASGKSHFELENETWQHYGPKVLAVTLFGGIVGGATATVLGASWRRDSHSSATSL